MAIAVLLLSATVFVYAFVKELQNVHGKCLMFFVTGILVTYISLPLLKAHFMGFFYIFTTIMFVIGFLFSLIWMSIMAFDIWWTLRFLNRTIIVMQILIFLHILTDWRNQLQMVTSDLNFTVCMPSA